MCVGRGLIWLFVGSFVLVAVLLVEISVVFLLAGFPFPCSWCLMCFGGSGFRLGFGKLSQRGEAVFASAFSCCGSPRCETQNCNLKHACA